jgi:putative nucleotidyltransferase with HDIG domain
MRNDQLDRLKAWFADYSRSFLTTGGAVGVPLRLKIEHTDEVCRNMVKLARAIDLNTDQVATAEAIGLLHDVGRFEQYQHFRTFSDRQSVNHATLGVRILDAAGVLEPLGEAEKAVIVRAIRFHNALKLPHEPSSATRVFIQLIRDADKLDIWRVFADYLAQPQRDPAIVQHLPDNDTWQEAIVSSLLEKRIAKLEDMRSLNDLKMLQLSWVFDLNFQQSYQLATEAGHLHAIARMLVRHPHIDQAVSMVMSHLDQMAARPAPQRPVQPHVPSRFGHGPA